MDDVRVGRLLRALRRRRGLRQLDVARAAGVSQGAVSLIERGHLSTLSIRAVRSVFAAVDARFEPLVTWRGGAVDRLLDERHAAVVDRCTTRLLRQGWDIHVEVTYSMYGERGSIDVLALRPALGLALVVEAKSELASIEETIRRLDAKDRLARGIVQVRFGWTPRHVARLLVIAEGATARRRVARAAGVLETAFPDRGEDVIRWLGHPRGRISGLCFLRVTPAPSRTNRRSARRQITPQADD